eukprot:411760-Rhodomonas_salina.1
MGHRVEAVGIGVVVGRLGEERAHATVHRLRIRSGRALRVVELRRGARPLSGQEQQWHAHSSANAQSCRRMRQARAVRGYLEGVALGVDDPVLEVGAVALEHQRHQTLPHHHTSRQQPRTCPLPNTHVLFTPYATCLTPLSETLFLSRRPAHTSD